MVEKINVNGLAIKEGVSRNGILYTAEELKKFTPTLKGVSIQKDHSASVNDSVGLVTETTTDTGKKIFYKGWVEEDGTGILNKIKDKRISHVSVGAMARLVKENDDSDVLMATNMVGAELSLVVCPGVPGASIQQTIKQIQAKEKRVVPLRENVDSFTEYKLAKVKKIVEKESLKEEVIAEVVEDKQEEKIAEVKEDSEVVNDKLTKETINMKLKEESKMTEESIKTLQEELKVSGVALEEKAKKLEEAEAKLQEIKVAQRKELEEKYKKLAEEKSMAALNVSEISDKGIMTLMETLNQVKVIKEEEAKEEPKEEEPKEEEPKEEPTDETKGEVGTEEKMEKSNEEWNEYVLERSKHNEFELYTEEYNPKFKRLSSRRAE